MTAHKDVLSAEKIEDVSKYVKAMSDEGKDKADADTAVAAGKAVFAESGCSACHGTDAKGIQAMGSANLTDKIWRFDGSLEGIKRTIAYGVNSGDPMARIAVMPNFKEAGKLSDSEIKKLAVYVYKFGGGQADAPAVAVTAATGTPAAAAK
jgi:cytochrome c oxidase cbb3-type subunit 3